MRTKKANVSEPPFTCRKGPMTSKPRSRLASGQAWGRPVYCPGGVRHIGGASLVQAPVRNVRTWYPETAVGGCKPTGPQEGDPQAAETARGRVPRGPGADRPVVAVKPGNAGGAKGTGYPGSINSQPADGRS